MELFGNLSACFSVSNKNLTSKTHCKNLRRRERENLVSLYRTPSISTSVTSICQHQKKKSRQTPT